MWISLQTLPIVMLIVLLVPLCLIIIEFSRWAASNFQPEVQEVPSLYRAGIIGKQPKAQLVPKSRF